MEVAAGDLVVVVVVDDAGDFAVVVVVVERAGDMDVAAGDRAIVVVFAAGERCWAKAEPAGRRARSAIARIQLMRFMRRSLSF